LSADQQRPPHRDILPARMSCLSWVEEVKHGIQGQTGYGVHPLAFSRELRHGERLRVARRMGEEQSGEGRESVKTQSGFMAY